MQSFDVACSACLIEKRVRKGCTGGVRIRGGGGGNEIVCVGGRV